MSKSNLLNNIRNSAAVGIASVLTYLGSSSAYAQNNDTNHPPVFASATQKQEDTQWSYDRDAVLSQLELPERLTQEGEDFYKDPHKEFEFYRNKYKELARDGFIDSEDVGVLEAVLAKTLEEIDGKLYNQHAALRDDFPNDVYAKLYLKIIQEARSNLKELSRHLEIKEDWLDSHAVRGKFWNYGSGLLIYVGSENNGNQTGNWRTGAIGLDSIFANGELYKSEEDRILNQRNSSVPEIKDLSDESPASTKFNYYLGLTAGLLAHPLLGIAGLIRYAKRGADLNDESDLATNMAYGGLVLSVAAAPVSWGLLDSIHPIVYPARIGIHATYEAGQWIFGKRDYSKPGKVGRAKAPVSPRPPIPKNNIEKKTEKTPEEDLPVSDFIDPWGIEISEEDKK